MNFNSFLFLWWFLLGISYVVEATATPVPTPVPSAEGCYANEVLLDFYASNVTVNNLGGIGPGTDEEELRCSKIGLVDGEWIDLVIRTFPDQSYEGNGNTNGKSGSFARLNMEVSTSTKFSFQFQYTADWKAAQTSGASMVPPVKLPVFTFTVFGWLNTPITLNPST